MGASGTWIPEGARIVSDEERYAPGPKPQQTTESRPAGTWIPEGAHIVSHEEQYAPGSKPPSKPDVSQGFFAPGNEAAKDPFAFSRAYAAAHPQQASSTWQKIKNYAGNALKPYEGAMAPQTVEQALSPFEMMAGELGGSILGSVGKTAAGSLARKAFNAFGPGEREAVPPARIPTVEPKPAPAPATTMPAVESKPAAPAAPTAIPTVGAQPSTRASVEKIGNLIEQGAGTQPLKPNVPLREQFPAQAKPVATVAETDPLKVKYPDPAVRQLVRANGEPIYLAAKGDPATIKAIHDLTRVDLRQALINSGEDMGQITVSDSKFAGPGSISRQDAFGRLLKKGYSPQEIVDLAKKEMAQGGHAGGGVSSVEEIKRGGQNYVVNPSGSLTYHGKSFAPESIRPGQAHVTVLPDGSIRTNAGYLSPSMEKSFRTALR